MADSQNMVIGDVESMAERAPPWRAAGFRMIMDLGYRRTRDKEYEQSLRGFEVSYPCTA